MVVHSVREMIRRIHDAGFTEAADAMRRRHIPCPVYTWDTYFKSGGNVFVSYDINEERRLYVNRPFFFEAPAVLLNPPQE